ncbi:MAG: 4a-hydroxytetrahydrobiopterin dehydratase [Ardenticatenia bacterium]|nr:4a-hydroxytetrahydrobiopterin dehydratase [Ardenticatenia bacterium]
MAKTRLKVYSDEEVRERLARELPDWYLQDGWIRRFYRTDGWQTTMMLVNTIGFLAEAAYHHPDLTVSWAKVWVKLQTHSAGGITDKDFELAKKIEEVVLWHPPKDSVFEGGTPNKFVQSGPKPREVDG